MEVRRVALADEAQVPGLVLVSGLRIDGHGMVPARGAPGTVFPVVGVDGVRDDEAVAPGVVVQPLAALRAAESVAEHLAVRRPVGGEHVHGRPELVLAVPRERALRRRLAEPRVRLRCPPREHPALRAEPAERRLDPPGHALEPHRVEHVVKRPRGVLAQAIACAVALCLRIAATDRGCRRDPSARSPGAALRSASD